MTGSDPATGVARRLSGRRKAAMLAVLTLVACILLAAAAETAVRMRASARYGAPAPLVTDPATGLKVPAPGTHSERIRINALGFRGPDLEVPKPPGTVRLAFLGGSTTYCSEVSGNHMTWPHLVTEGLRDRFPGVRFDYVNAAVPGYGVGQSLQRLEHHVAPVEPDVVVIYHATNDLSSNSFDLARERGLVRARPAGDRFWLSRHSLLVDLVEKNLKILFRQQTADVPEGKLAVDPAPLATPFRRDLRALVEAAGRAADRAVVLTFSQRLRPDQTHEEQTAAAVTSLFYMPYMSIDGLLAAFAAYNGVIREVVGATGSLLVDVAEGIPGDGHHFHDSVHFTDAGSAAMADRVISGLTASNEFRRFIEERAAAARR